MIKPIQSPEHKKQLVIVFDKDDREEGWEARSETLDVAVVGAGM